MIYVDNAATTKVRPEVISVMLPWLTDYYGNPSSQHTAGRLAKNVIERSREIIAAKIHCQPDEIFFTSGASEANTQAIFSMALSSDPKKRIVSTPIEHKSVLNSLKCLSDEGRTVEYINIDKSWLDRQEELGTPVITGDSFKLDADVALVSAMMINNEIGVLLPIEKIGQKCDEYGIPFHVDATQALGKFDIDVRAMNIGLMSASAHKIHGPKGVGFLYVNRKYRHRITPLIQGGKQEQGFRPGTENVAGIVGFSKAVEICNNIDGEIALDFDTAFYGSRVSHKAECYGTNNIRVIDFSQYDLTSEQIVAYLDDNDIYVSGGSACNEGSAEPSHVLRAIGFTDKQASSCVRFSFDDEFNTKKDNDEIMRALETMVDVLC